MNDIDKKSSHICDCKGGKGKDCIVITIETCCRKTCDKTLIALSSGEEVQPGAILTESGDAIVAPLYDSEPSKTELQEVVDDDRVPSRAELRDPSVVKSKSELEHPETIHSKSGPSLHDPEVVRSKEELDDSDDSTLKQSESGRHILQPPPESKVRSEYGRTLKLPLLLDRHHGPGCAMEISVLEKHEDSCAYKKENVEGRSADDRVGSYECIGRLVFRTCNQNELESDSSGSAYGINGGASPTVLSSNYKPVHQTPPQTPPPTPAAVSPGAPQQHSRQRSSHITLDPSPVPSIIKAPVVSPSAPHHVPRQPSQLTNHSVLKPHVEESFQAKTQHPLQAFKKMTNSMDLQQIMTATVSGIPDCPGCKKHFYGDACKLHGPKIPWSHFAPNENIYASKKTFPVYTDEGNQTDAFVRNAQTTTKRSRQSLETIASLSDLSKNVGKPKKNFFGSLFRKSSIKSDSIGSSRRFRP